MVFSRVTPAQVEAIIDSINGRYSGNVCGEWQRSRYRHEPTRISANRWRGRIMVYDSYGPGARRSWSGRRMPAACWHVFRDLIEAILRQYPAARVSTGMASYTADTWEDRYPETGTRNIGSLMSPVSMRELCPCESGIVPVTPRRSQPTYRAAVAGVQASYDEAPPDVERDFGPYPDLLRRIDATITGTLKVAEGECATCSQPTGSAAMVWCSAACQGAYQSRLGK